MRALVKWEQGSGNAGIREVPVPEPGAGEVLIRVEAASICGSDIHVYHDEFPHEPPMVMGHEFSGTVERSGAGVTGLEPGDAVVSENNPCACGTCPACRAGFPNVCPAKRAIGFKMDGCFAEYVKIPAHLLHRVPDGVSFAAAALSEPLAVAVHAVEDRCGIEEGDTVVVLGPGAVGLLAAQVARVEGAGRVIVAGMDRDVPRRLACAGRLGFETASVEQEDILQRILSVTGGTGADVVVEAAGVTPAVTLGTRLLRRAGRMVVLGITGKPSIPVPWDELVVRGATVHFSFSSRKRNWEKAMDYLAAKKVETEQLITSRFPLERWEEAFERSGGREDIRVLLEMTPPAQPSQ